MKDRKQILICIDWYEPGFKAGGPIRSVVNIVNALKEDFEFYILTSAYDFGEQEPYEDVTLNQWFDHEGVFIKYLDRTILNPGAIKRNILEINPDIIYLNSLFSRLFTLTPLVLARRKRYKVILAPRGMLGEAALDIRKSKKQTFLIISRLLGVYKKVNWHASGESEKADIRKKFGRKSKVHIAQNIPLGQKLKLNTILDKKKTGNVRFIYISRISVIKNLHLAILAIKQTKRSYHIYFDIYGNIEDEEYWNKFKDELGEFDNLTIEYKGIVPPTELPETFANADYLILPSKHESYGHAIVEAWSNGCPVIISRNTPWKNLHVQKLGWDVDLKNFDNLVKAIQEAIDLDFASYIGQCTASYNYFKDVITDSEVIDANRNLFMI